MTDSVLKEMIESFLGKILIASFILLMVHVFFGVMLMQSATESARFIPVLDPSWIFQVNFLGQIYTMHIYWYILIGLISVIIGVMAAGALISVIDWLVEKGKNIN